MESAVAWGCGAECLQPRAPEDSTSYVLIRTRRQARCTSSSTHCSCQWAQLPGPTSSAPGRRVSHCVLMELASPCRSRAGPCRLGGYYQESSQLVTNSASNSEFTNAQAIKSMKSWMPRSSRVTPPLKHELPDQDGQLTSMIRTWTNLPPYSASYRLSLGARRADADGNNLQVIPNQELRCNCS